MKLSIVIPTYNRSSVLGLALTSFVLETPLLSQIEIIVADDASLPKEQKKNQAVCEAAGVRYVVNATNRGPAATRNAGMALCQGEWIAFVDDDVRVAPGWCNAVLATLAAQGPEVVGVEGKIVGRGKGLWDREVENISGGLYLTGHIVYKKEILAAVGGFDEAFRGPFCEDQELAACMLLQGRIVFTAELVVFHQPRNVNLIKYVLGSVGRTRVLLDSEFYFYRKHPDRYHLFRFARHFWGTLLSWCLKNIYITLKRHAREPLHCHPLQYLALIMSAVIEQVTAILLVPRYLYRWFSRPTEFFQKLIDLQKTARIWGLSQTPSLSDFRLFSNPIKSLLFPFFKKTPHALVKTLKRFSVHLNPASGPLRVFIRLDDMFFNRGFGYDRFIGFMESNRAPFLAAITGPDLALAANWPLVKAIKRVGGTIALHGFSHAGTFGPFDSEILQMKLPEFDTALHTVLDHGLPDDCRPDIFVPPFNAISRQHIISFSKYFKVICGGPESARFTDQCFGPVALSSGTIYFPAFQPFCYSARKMEQGKVLDSLKGISGFVCLNFHFPDEVADNFKSLGRILKRFSDQIVSWDYLLKEP